MYSILVACLYRKSEFNNRYLPLWVDGLKALGLDVVWSPEEFWYPTRRYDIIHFQWPEALLWGISPEHLAAIKWRIKAWKAEGVKMVMTRHNEAKHYAKNKLYSDLYKLVESSCDVIVHLGEYSKNTIPAANCSPNVRHVIIPHHIYPNLDRTLSQEESKRQLGWHRSKKYVLAFGTIRDDEERKMILSAAHALKKDNICVYAPRFYQSPLDGLTGLNYLEKLRERIRFRKYGLYIHEGGEVSMVQMQQMFAACDAVMIPRIKVLNSGNLAMGFYFGKVVVGPDVGNVGEILRKTQNVVFNPLDKHSIIEAIRKAVIMSETSKGEENRLYADKYWSVDVVCKMFKSVYDTIQSG